MSEALAIGVVVSACVASVSALLAVIWHIVKFSRWTKGVDKIGEDFMAFREEAREDSKTLKEGVDRDLKAFREEAREDSKTLREDFRTLKEGVDRDLKAFKVEVREDFREIRGDIKKLFAHVSSSLADTGSPIHLTELGEDISKKVGGKKWAAEIAPTLVDRVKGFTPYEVQEFCTDYVRDEVELYKTPSATPPTHTPPGTLSMTLVHSCAYESGVTVDEVMWALSFELRDVLLSLTRQETGSPAP